jgi:hypothetical protein
MNAVDFLLQEHRMTEQKFREIEQADPQQRASLWRRLRPELKMHEQLEDDYLYGPLARDPRLEGTELGTFQQHQDDDVQQLEQKMSQLNQMEPTGDEWLAKFSEIRDALMSHVQEEETRILPKVPEVWDQTKLEEAGRMMEEMKRSHAGQTSQTGQSAR